MPGSVVSAVGSQTSSASSRRGKTKNYRTVSNHSQIDESLFGAPNHVSKRQEMLQDKWNNNQEITIEQMARERSSKRKNGNGKKGKETVQVITKDLIRNLIVPTEDPSGQSMILQRYDFYRVLKSAEVLTKEQKLAELARIKEEKLREEEECERRKNQMKEYDMDRRKNEALNDLEEEAKENAEHLLAKANEMRQEQEDEIKHLNELILNAKCHAIRDAQILEKHQIKGEMISEEKRLDSMMEVDRQNAIKIQEEIEKQRKGERYLGAAKLLDQIQENEESRLFDLERKDMENVQMQKYIEKMMEEDKTSLEKRKVEQTVLREELNKANDEMIHRKTLRAEQERAEEEKVIEYMKKKAEREAAYEKEQERIRIEKEKETSRLRALQERARDEQAERDALRAKRAQEQTEREWRKKEAEEMRKKAETECMLIEARAKQMNQKEHFLAVQAQRERVEFERVLHAQKELVEKERREELEATKKRHTHADDVRQQIRQKETHRIMERNAFFEEGVKLDEEARIRRSKLEEVKRKKLGELRDAGIPERYVTHVAHKVDVVTAS
ncbi:cilia- and flagella-associated protein 45-like isoform X2 [Pecten maximus]|uniref:cilia- and flagella-associated protein 45-like isoform X2 n=1 Tax=Pecten maximus TaxID=6579 RepID=UPI001458763C|nr:cilia- and flagella-associated protein 45-like isoform X2 [Pecten maximus]